jgi:hypothetical protein
MYVSSRFGYRPSPYRQKIQKHRFRRYPAIEALRPVKSRPVQFCAGQLVRRGKASFSQIAKLTRLLAVVGRRPTAIVDSEKLCGQAR